MLLYKRRSPRWLQQLILVIGISLLFLFPIVKELGMSFSFLPKNVVELEVNWYPFHTTIERNFTSPPPPTQQNHPTLPTILFVTFVHLQDFSRFEKFIFPALDTFLQDDVYFVVLSQRWETKYHTELCTWNQTYSTYCQRIHPIFVDCPEGYFGIAPCCKQEKGLLQISQRHSKADWILYMDDDIYIRSWHLKKFLSKFDPSNDAMLVTAGGKRSMHRPLGQTGYSRYPSYPCSKNANFTYPWGRPVLYSRAARDIVIKGGWYGTTMLGI
jgi:Fringe-like